MPCLTRMPGKLQSIFNGHNDVIFLELKISVHSRLLSPQRQISSAFLKAWLLQQLHILQCSTLRCIDSQWHGQESTQQHPTGAQRAANAKHRAYCFVLQLNI